MKQYPRRTEFTVRLINPFLFTLKFYFMETYEKTFEDFVEFHGKDEIKRKMDLIRYFALSHAEAEDHIERSDVYTFLGNLEELLMKIEPTPQNQNG